MMEPDPTPNQALKCHLCGSAQLRLVASYEKMSRVTSDCKPWPAGGLLGVCEICHLVQTVVTSRWHDEAARIYADYTIYHQSGGVEQSVFAKDNGEGRRRSEVIFASLTKHRLLPDTGSLLDLGCGNGAFLRAAGDVLQGWRLFGAEWDDKYLYAVQAIPGFECLHTGDWSNIPGKYDVISMVHVLEHIASPQPVLELIRSKLSENGLLLIEVPDCLVNPYMLLIADHCSHFSVNTLRALVEAAGFEVVVATNAWVQKEITVVARAVDKNVQQQVLLPDDDADAIMNGPSYLDHVLKLANEASNAESFGIFGTSIAATWLASHLGEKVKFFVDEDPNRAAGVHMGKPILVNQQIPASSTVFVALPQPLAEQVVARNRRLGVTYVMP